MRSFHLEPKKARGVIGVKFSHVTDTTPQSLVLQITDGKNLPKADPFHLSDPYCTITFNGGTKKEWKTKTIKETLDPVWHNAYFTFPLPAGEEAEFLSSSEAKIDVWDWDRIGTDDHLGRLTFTGAEILKLCEKSTETQALGLDDEALKTIEMEWKRLEGTPKASEFKVSEERGRTTPVNKNKWAGVSAEEVGIGGGG